MSSRPKPTIADYIVIALSPALIMLLIGSLVFFLIEVFYQGQFNSRLTFITAMFVMAAVLIARISIEESREHSILFAIPLALVTAVAMYRFVEFSGPLQSFSPLINLGLIGLIWWCADKLTWDSTVIDESQDASGEGLLQTAGLDQEATTQDAAAEAASRVTTPLTLWQRFIAYRRRQHSPGVWVIYFSIAALPIFGFGHWFIPSEDLAARRYVFKLLVVFVAAALGLLLTTSFLNLRRYLRQRRLEMPAEMAGTWIGTGAAMIVALLVVCMLLPRRNPEYSVTQLPIFAGSPTDLWTTEYSVGDEGQKEQEGQKVQEGQEGQEEKTGQEGQEGQQGQQGRQGQQGEPSSDSAKKSPDQSGERTSSDQGKQEKQEKQGSSGKQPSQDKQPSKSSGQSSEKNDQTQPDKSQQRPSDQQREAGDQQEKKSEQSKSKQSKSQQSKSEQPKSEQSKSEPEDSTSPSEPQPVTKFDPSKIFSALGGTIGQLLKLLYWVIALGIAAYFTWKYWSQIRAALANFWQAVCNFWGSLFGRKPNEVVESAPAAEVAPPPKPFSAFHDPFVTGAAQRQPAVEVVQYSFSAFEAWAREQGCARAPEQTPQEFVQFVGQHQTGIARDAASLGELYNRCAYARDLGSRVSVESLRRLWLAMNDSSRVAGAND